MRKVLTALLLTVLLSGSAFGAGIRIGSLVMNSMSEDDFQNFVKTRRADFPGWRVMSNAHSNEDKRMYFNSLASMLMALRSGKIDEAAVPSFVAEYVVNTNSDFTIKCAVRVPTTHLELGFRDDESGRRLCEMVNIALKSMKSDETLNMIHTKYLGMPGKSQPSAEVPVKIPGAETVRVAVTGDLPPLDMISPGGVPVGFNTAVLAELGRRMSVNVEIVNIETAARTSALMSGRVDVVFWYICHSWNTQPDVPEGILLSEPYYGWDMIMHLKNAK